MRQKTYYSIDEIISDLYTYGSEFMTTDLQEYVGLYHIYTTGEVYTQPNWDTKLSKELIQIKKIDPIIELYKSRKSINVKYNTPKSTAPIITDDQRKSGIMKRYFLKNVTTNIILEVDKSQHDLYDKKLIDPVLYSKLSIDWKISGNVNNTITNGITDRGVREYNTSILQQSELVMPGITNYLTDLLEYYIPPANTIPKDINE